MRYSREIILICLFLLLASCNNPGNYSLDEIQNNPHIPSISPKGCGDGICDGPETTGTCPEDCQIVQADDRSSTSDLQPLYFFYTIHAHGSEEFLPYTGPDRNEIDPAAAGT